MSKFKAFFVRFLAVFAMFFACMTGGIMSSYAADPTYDFTITLVGGPTKFNFVLAASGTYGVYCDNQLVCNDSSVTCTGTAPHYTISKAGVSESVFTCVSSGVNIGFVKGNSGSFGYSAEKTVLSFPDDKNQISQISGSLGKVFPTLSSSSYAKQPIFKEMFQKADYINGSVPAELFCVNEGLAISGAPVKYMFSGMFQGAGGAGTGLILPGSLFKCLSGNVDSFVFQNVFQGAKVSSTSSNIAEDFFGDLKIADGVSDTTMPQGVFSSAFEGCANLKGMGTSNSVPVKLFAGIARSINHDDVLVNSFVKQSMGNVFEGTSVASSCTGVTFPSRIGNLARYDDGGVYTAAQVGASGIKWGNKVNTNNVVVACDGYYNISLNRNDGTNETTTIYTTFNRDVYRTDNLSTVMTTGSNGANPVDVPTRTGYTFNGYYDTSASSGGTQYIDNGGHLTVAGRNAGIGYTSDTIWYAQWTANTYAVTYSCGDGTGTAPSGPTPATYNATYTPAANSCSRAGYTFAGWKVSGTNDVKAAGTRFTWTYTGAKTFTAQWTANTFNVNYNGNGGSGANPTAPTSCEYGLVCNAPSNTYTRTGYTFNGWACIASSGNCTNSTYAAGDSISTATTVNGATITLTAQWEEEVYKVPLDDGTNGGQGGSGVVYEKYGIGWSFTNFGTTTTNVAVPTTRDSIGTFIGYWTEPNGGDLKIPLTGVLPAPTTITRDGTLYAKFDECTCTNGANVSSCTATGVSENKCRYSYTCNNGYHVGSSGTTSTDTFTATNAGVGSNTSPDCSANTHTITFRTTRSSQTQNCLHGQLVNLTTLNNLTDLTPIPSSSKGWGFYKWATDINRYPGDGGAEITYYNDGQEITCNGDMTLYGIWSRQVSFTYYDDDTLTTQYRTQYYYNPSASANAATSSMDTYTLSSSSYGWNPYSWYRSASGRGMHFVWNAQYVTLDYNRDPHYYAVYARPVTVNYNANGGEGSTETTNATQYYNSGTNGAVQLDISPESNAFTRTGYTFSNWAESSNGNNPVAGNDYTFPNTTWTSSSEKTLYAQWIAQTSTVTLNANGGTGGTPSVVATYDSAMPNATMPTRSGYTFAGYYDTSAVTGGTQYYTAAGASAQTWNKTGAQTLWARWTPNCNAITVNFADNGGSWSVGMGTLVDSITLYKYTGSGAWSVSNTCDSSYAITSLISPYFSNTLPEKTNATYAGTYVNRGIPNGTQAIGADGTLSTSWAVTGPTTIYAHYNCNENYQSNGTDISGACVANTYTITYENMSGATNFAGAPTSYTVEDLPITLGTPTKTGYTFGGWYDNSNLTGTAITQIPQGSSGNKTFYAKWSQNIVANAPQNTGFPYDGNSHTCPAVTVTAPNNYTLQYNCGNGWQNAQCTVTNVIDSITVSYRVSADGVPNVQGSYSCSVTPADLTVSATGNSKSYDGNPLYCDGGTWTGVPTGATITYNTDGGSVYGSQVPSRNPGSVGTTTVYYQVNAGSNYNIATGTYSCSIGGTSCTPSISANSGSATCGSSTTSFTVNRGSCNGNVTVSSNNTNVATASLSGDTVTVTRVGVGTATISVNVATTPEYTPTVSTLSYTFSGTKVAGFTTITDGGVSVNSGSVNVSQGKTLNVSCAGNANPSLTNSGSGSVATANLNGNTLSFTGVAYGTSQVTVSCPATDCYNASSTTYTLTVNKADCNITLTPASGTVNIPYSATFTVSSESNGVISAVSSDTGVATVSNINNSQVTLSAVAPGSASITVSIAATNNYNACTPAVYALEVNPETCTEKLHVKKEGTEYIYNMNKRTNYTPNTDRTLNVKFDDNGVDKTCYMTLIPRSGNQQPISGSLNIVIGNDIYHATPALTNP